jgi:hypothetical protein
LRECDSNGRAFSIGDRAEGSFAAQNLFERTKPPAKPSKNPACLKSIPDAQATIFGHLLPLDSRGCPEKPGADPSATAEFCRMKIDFALLATKLPRR